MRSPPLLGTNDLSVAQIAYRDLVHVKSRAIARDQVVARLSCFLVTA
jgi:hypothetical protein